MIECIGITDRPHNIYIYIRTHQETPEQVMNSGPISLPQNKWDRKRRPISLQARQQYPVCLSVIFVSRWRIPNMKPHVSCKPDGWIPIGVSRTYILSLRWVSLVTILQITYLLSDIYVDFSRCTEQSRGEYGRRGARGRRGWGNVT